MADDPAPLLARPRQEAWDVDERQQRDVGERAVVAAVGAGAAYADRAGMGMGHGPFGQGPAGRIQHFCATDVTYVSGRVANHLTEQLKLTEPQKASLKDLQDSFVKAATDAGGAAILALA